MGGYEHGVAAYQTAVSDGGVAFYFVLFGTFELGGIQEGLLEERIFRILKKLFLFFLLGKLNFW